MLDLLLIFVQSLTMTVALFWTTWLFSKYLKNNLFIQHPQKDTQRNYHYNKRNQVPGDSSTDFFFFLKNQRNGEHRQHYRNKEEEF